MLQGNIFATRPGKKSGPPTYAGSHLDTQVSSNFVLRSLYELDINEKEEHG